jgi:hypothetical protein
MVWGPPALSPVVRRYQLVTEPLRPLNRGAMGACEHAAPHFFKVFVEVPHSKNENFLNGKKVTFLL